ncbi:hypothetical protein EVAR_33472_1 [Eumeta japonica]|uniref:Uncharacterized protein n=1 Tax=Eumeta variegata TaxID=151549 RepID=A0A4C1WED7_EUMVA|nr:hypothetical protein EVAR_33472_1 [Eumeta japonica]
MLSPYGSIVYLGHNKRVVFPHTQHYRLEKLAKPRNAIYPTGVRATSAGDRRKAVADVPGMKHGLTLGGRLGRPGRAPPPPPSPPRRPLPPNSQLFYWKS